MRLMIPMLLMLPLYASALSPEAVRDNNEGVDQLKSENTYQAYQQFLKTLSEEPFAGEAHLNLGLVFEVNKEEEKALKQYKSILNLPSLRPEVRFAALFNSARLYGNLGKIAKALEHYQLALDMAPDSKEVKTNIELLWQQQGQGQGEGQSDEPQQNPQDGEQGQNDQQKNENQQGQQQKQQKQPKPFESRELTKDDVRKILEEIKAQENAIRAKEFSKSVKERPREKDW